nr:MAG TPA: hypothetical protein [Caudoviricetes sp.]
MHKVKEPLLPDGTAVFLCLKWVSIGQLSFCS